MKLNKHAEDFLTKLRLELIFRGREENEINEIDEELRDHFTTAEANGESVDDIIQQPVKSYADNFAKEMHLSRGIYKFAFSLLIFLLALSIIPEMFDANFQISLMFLFKIGFFIISFIVSLYVLKYLLMHYLDSKGAYIGSALWFMFLFLCYLGMNYLVKHHPLALLWQPTTRTSIILGLICWATCTIYFLVVKHKLSAIALAIICAPSIIGMLATGKNYGSHYTMISLILILIGWFLFSAIGGWITFRKRKE